MKYFAIVLPIILLAQPAFALETQQIDASGQPIVCRSINVSDAVTVALANNPTLASRQSALAAAAARVGMARAMTRPQVSASTFATASNMPMILPGATDVQPQNFSLTSDKPRLDQNLMAMYPLYTGGRLSGQVNSASSLQRASSLDEVTGELDVSLAVKNAYYQVLLAKQFVDAYQRRVDEATERVRIANEAYSAGRVAKYDLLRNQTDLAEAQQQLNDSQRDLDTATIDLKSVMGVSQSSQLTLTQELTLQSSDQTLENLTACALKQRPEVAAARARIRSAQANLSVAKSAYKPQVYATAMADAAATSNEGSGTGYLVGVAASLPILDGGLRKSSVDEAHAMIAQMQADERDAVLSVTRSVAMAYAQLNAAAKNVTLAQASVAQADEDYRVIRMRYEAGKATNVEVLDALATLTRAQTSYAQALYSHNVARETLNRAIGQR